MQAFCQIPKHLKDSDLSQTPTNNCILDSEDLVQHFETSSFKKDLAGIWVIQLMQLSWL